MDDSILSSLQDRNLALRKELGEKKKILAELESFSLGYKPSFPLATATMGKFNKATSSLDVHYNALAKAKEDVESALKDLDSIEGFADSFKDTIVRVKNLDEAGLYDSAFLLLDDLDKIIESFDEERFRFILTAKEISAYERCALYYHKGESNIAKGAYPMEKEEILKYLGIASSLSTVANPESLKAIHIDEAKGLLYFFVSNVAKTTLPTIESFLEMLSVMEIYGETNEYSLVSTRERAEQLKSIFITQFNELSYEYFENEPNYDKALTIYRGRKYLLITEIDHYAYKESEDEKSFYYAFIKASCLKKSPTAYNDSVLVYGQKASDNDEEAFMILAHIISMPLLDAAKFNMALRATSKFDFVQKLRLLETVVRLGIDKEKAALVFDEVNKMKKEGDLEEMAGSLNYLNYHIDPSIRQEFNALRLSLLRSTKAHRVKIKSTNEALHLVFGEEKGTYPVPVGKKLKNTRVKAWSMSTLLLYWFFIAFVPIVGATLAMFAIFNNHLEEQLTSYIYAAPIGVVYVMSLIIGIQWFSNDEWESSVFRRIMLFVSMAMLITTLVYYISPSVLTGLKIWSIPLFVVATGSGLLSILIIRERKRVWGYVTIIPFALLALACAIFVILDGFGITI